MSEIDSKGKAEQKKAQKDERKRRADTDDQEGKESTVNLMPWDADVDRFIELLDRAVGAFRISMSSADFRDLVARYRNLTPTEKRAIANRMQRMGLGSTLRALHAGDYRMYCEGFEAESKAAIEREAGPKPDSP